MGQFPSRQKGKQNTLSPGLKREVAAFIESNLQPQLPVVFAAVHVLMKERYLKYMKIHCFRNMQQTETEIGFPMGRGFLCESNRSENSCGIGTKHDWRNLTRKILRNLFWLVDRIVTTTATTALTNCSYFSYIVVSFYR